MKATQMYTQTQPLTQSYAIKKHLRVPARTGGDGKPQQMNNNPKSK